MDAKFEEKIALIKFFPGSNPNIIGHYIEEGYKGLIIEATGLGHVSTDESEKNWIHFVVSLLHHALSSE